MAPWIYGPEGFFIHLFLVSSSSYTTLHLLFRCLSGWTLLVSPTLCCTLCLHVMAAPSLLAIIALFALSFAFCFLLLLCCFLFFLSFYSSFYCTFSAGFAAFTCPIVSMSSSPSLCLLPGPSIDLLYIGFLCLNAGWLCNGPGHFA